jgi:uncharacterized protein YkwD
MLANNTFSHARARRQQRRGPDGGRGVCFTGSWTWGENLAWYGTTGRSTCTRPPITHDSGLFLSAGHRVNLLADAYREIGIAQVEGAVHPYQRHHLQRLDADGEIRADRSGRCS